MPRNSSKGGVVQVYLSHDDGCSFLGNGVARGGPAASRALCHYAGSGPLALTTGSVVSRAGRSTGRPAGLRGVWRRSHSARRPILGHRSQSQVHSRRVWNTPIGNPSWRCTDRCLNASPDFRDDLSSPGKWSLADLLCSRIIRFPRTRHGLARHWPNPAALIPRRMRICRIPAIASQGAIQFSRFSRKVHRQTSASTLSNRARENWTGVSMGRTDRS